MHAENAMVRSVAMTWPFCIFQCRVRRATLTLLYSGNLFPNLILKCMSYNGMSMSLYIHGMTGFARRYWLHWQRRLYRRLAGHENITTYARNHTWLTFHGITPLLRRADTRATNMHWRKWHGSPVSTALRHRHNAIMKMAKPKGNAQ